MSHSSSVCCGDLWGKDVVTGRSRTGALALEVQKALKEKREREAIERKRQEEEELMKARAVWQDLSHCDLASRNTQRFYLDP